MDPQGNVVALLDSAGNCVENYRYTAFGESETFSKTTLNNPWRFSSKRYDAETGFHYFGRRYYAADIGRWTTADPAGYADGPNLYAYVHNHPMAYIDPDGQLAWFLFSIAASIALEYSLPVAVTMAEPYVGIAAASLLSGVAKGCDGSYSLNPTADPVLEVSGMALGTAVCWRKTAANLTRVGVNLARNEIAEFSIKNITAKATKAFQWHKSKDAIPQITQKTSEAAEKLLKPQQKNLTVATQEIIDAAKATRTRFVPDINAYGAHTVFRRDKLTGRINHYETFVPQANFRNPNPWETLKRFDNSGKMDAFHYNKILKKKIYEPHVHMDSCPGGVRSAEIWEIPI